MIELNKFEIFSGLPEDVLHKISTRQKIKKLKRGEFVYKASDKPENLYLVNRGLFGLTIYTEKGREHMVRLYKKGQFFGHRSLLSNESYHTSAVSLENSELILIPSDCIYSLLDRFPQLAKSVIRYLAKELRNSEMHRILISDSDVEVRVAATLLYIKEVDWLHRWTRKEIADFCGSTGPTVTKILIKFKERGLIEFNGREINILKRDNLANLGGISN